MRSDESPGEDERVEDGPEAIQVLVIRSNKLYLLRAVRDAFDLHNGDKVVVYNDKGQISIKVIRRFKVSDTS
jgi:hypothetical protein